MSTTMRLTLHVPRMSGDRVTQVYIPATLAMLQQLVADGSLWPVNGTAFAVTPTLREAYAEGDDDELADVALREAALASLRLLAAAKAEGADQTLPLRRAVLAAEVDDVKFRPDLDDAVVQARRAGSDRPGGRRIRRQRRRRAGREQGD